MRKRHFVVGAVALVTATLVLGTAFTASAQSDKPTATDVGVTATEIRIGVVADNDNPFVPGIFKGAADAVQGAAKYINANGGICRTRLVRQCRQCPGEIVPAVVGNHDGGNVHFLKN